MTTQLILLLALALLLSISAFIIFRDAIRYYRIFRLVKKSTRPQSRSQSQPQPLLGVVYPKNDSASNNKDVH
jgi:hypothetical protein